jgi:hypothetical protein
VLKESRIKDLFNLLKVANSLESYFVNYMLSNSFSNFEEEEEEAGQINLEEKFVELLAGLSEGRGSRNMGAVIFWLQNAPLAEQSRIGYAEDLYYNILEDSSYGESFVRAINYLASNKHGENGITILEAILSRGKVKEALDKSIEYGISGYNYKLLMSKDLRPFFVTSGADLILSEFQKVEGQERIAYDAQESFGRSLYRVKDFGSDIRQAIFIEIKDKINILLTMLESDDVYFSNKMHLASSVVAVLGDQLDKDTLERFKAIEFYPGKDVVGESPTTYVLQVQRAIDNRDLRTLYELKINEYLRSKERSIVSYIISTVEQGSDDEEFIEKNILNIFLEKNGNLANRFPSLFSRVINLAAEKMPSRFLQIEYVYRPYSSMKIDYTEELIRKALRGLFYKDAKRFIRLYTKAHNDGAIELVEKDITEETFKDIFLEEIENYSSWGQADVDSLIYTFKFVTDDTELARSLNLRQEIVDAIFDHILESLDDSSNCADIVNAVYHASEDAAPYVATIYGPKLANKIEQDIDKYYKCYLSNDYMIKRWTQNSEVFSKRITRKILRKVIEDKDSITYFEYFYKNYSRGQTYALIPEPFRYSLKRLESVSEMEEAKEIYSNSHNDIDAEPIPGSRVKYSEYQTEQRPSALREGEVSRYDLTLDNVDPSSLLYQVNKDYLSAIDFAVHTKLGSSGFTSAWALVSFPEDKLLIEQIQSDYPIVLDRVFRRMPPKKRLYRAIRYVSSTGSAFELKYRENEGGVYIERTNPLKEEEHRLSLGYNEEDEEGKLEIMSQEDYQSYIERAKEFHEKYKDWSASEEEKGKAYEELSIVYRERVLKIRSVLDGLGLVPASFAALKNNSTEEEFEDARKHIDLISQNYPYLIIINAIKTSQRMGKGFIYMLKSGGSAIQNIKKRKKIYLDLPNALGAESDKIMNMNVFKIPATMENITKVNAMMPVKKSPGYNYSLTPSQNKAVLAERQETQRRERRSEREKSDIKLSRDQIMPVLLMLDEAGVKPPREEIDAIDTAGDLLRFLGKYRGQLRAAGVSKRKLKKVQSEVARLRLAEIIETLGIKKFGAKKTISLYSLLINCELNKEAEELYSIFENVSNNKNLLLRRNDL